jgi:ABC-2 type transport system ATP-binding protein
VIARGKLLLVEEKTALMRKLGRTQLMLTMQETLASVPDALAPWHLELRRDGSELVYTYDAQAETSGIPALLRQLGVLGLDVKGLQTKQSSLEDIFVDLVHGRNAEQPA